MFNTISDTLVASKLPTQVKKESIGEKILSFLEITKNEKVVPELPKLIKDKYIIIGVPDDRGVALNGGNAGAKHGPEYFRKEFYKLFDTSLRAINPSTHKQTTSTEFDSKLESNSYLSQTFIDAGDIKLAESIAETHENIARAVEFFLKNGARKIFVVGGGHDFSYGSYKGHVLSRPDEVIPIINFDAHFDLRKVVDGVINSGTAFSRIIENFEKNIAKGKALLEIGIQRERNPHHLYEYAQNLGIPIIEYIALQNVWRDFYLGHAQEPLEHIYDHLDDCSIHGFKRTAGSLHFSLCLDVFAQNIAPGTSASSAFGIQLKDITPSLVFLGKSQLCRVIDIAELCPERDNTSQTAKLAASLVYNIVLLHEEYSLR